MNDIYIYAYVLYTGTCCITDCISIQYIYISLRILTFVMCIAYYTHTHTDEVCDPKGAFIGIRQGQLGVKRASVKH